MVNVKKTDKKKEEVHEIYEVQKNGKEEIVETKGTVNEEVIRKGQKAEENKLLVKILLFLGLILLVILIYSFVLRSQNHFTYEGVKFTVIQQGELIFYNTSFPLTHGTNQTIYNIYLRNDPRKIGKTVPAPDAPFYIDNTVINITQEFDCNGDQVIAIANLVQLYGALGKKLIRDENASCDSLGRYIYLVVQPGNETKIEKVGPSCYNIDINNCQILEGTERYILEMLVKINEDNKYKQ